MAEKQSKTVRLKHINGSTVVVAEEKVERLVGGGLFARPDPKPESGDGAPGGKSDKPAGSGK